MLIFRAWATCGYTEVKVTWAKRASSVQVSRPSNCNTCGNTNKCPLFHLLLTEEKCKFKKSCERKTKNFVFLSSLQVKGK